VEYVLAPNKFMVQGLSSEVSGKAAFSFPTLIATSHSNV